MTTASAEQLQAFLTDVFTAAGTPPDLAEVPAEHLVRANVSGYDSHGVVHIDHYLGEIDEGIIIPTGRPEVGSRRPSSAVVDAHQGWGHVAGLFALEEAMTMAEVTGIGAVSVRNCTHIGRLGHYVEEAASKGFISMVTWGAGVPPTWGPPKEKFHLAVPYGGARPTLSTNPFAFGVPTGDDAPFVVDFATTVIANAKAWIYRDLGQPMPPGCALGPDGQPTTDPDVYMNGGTLLTFGQHKGYGISLITTLLGGLTGTFLAPNPNMEGPFFMAMDPAAFIDPDEYQQAVRSYLDGMTETPPAPGFSEVMVPGSYEARSREQTALTGIELSPAVLASLTAAGRRFGVELLAPA